MVDMKMTLVHTLFALVLSLLLFGENVCDAAPMSEYLSDSSDMADPDMQRILINQELKRQMLQNWPSQDGADKASSYDRTGFRRLIARKRLAAQKRTNGGGVALCLWKVCPAGPWLVSKK